MEGTIMRSKSSAEIPREAYTKLKALTRLIKSRIKAKIKFKKCQRVNSLEGTSLK